jgi:tetratricopeptide (TPR) repeat protein
VLEKIEKEFPARKEIAAVRLTKANVLLDGLNRTGQAMDLFDELIQVHTDESPVYWQATVGKAKALHKQQRYEAARTLLQQVIAGKPEQAGLCAAAQWLIAAAYEAQGQWDRAIVEYRWISDKYPATPQGLSVPLHVADYYRKRGQDKLVDQALQQAVKHFQELVKKYPKTVLAGMAQEYIIYCLAFLKEWDMAIEAAGNLKQIYPGTRSDISSMLFLAQIYENIDQGDEARKVYARFIESYPEHPMVSQVKEKIAGFQ